MKTLPVSHRWLLPLFLLGSFSALGQGVGIGTTTPDASAALDVVSTSKGALLPRVALATGVATPAPGLLVFQTSAPAGFYCNTGTAASPHWQLLAADDLGSHTATQNLLLGTNALTGAGADLGTTVGVGVRADGGLNLGQNNGNNLYLGYLAGQANTTGTNNFFGGYRSGYFNTTGSNNFFGGNDSGYKNTTGINNLFIGQRSGTQNTTGNNNIFFGSNCAQNNTTGSQNLFSGLETGSDNTTGSDNLFGGFRSGFANTTGNRNVFSGSLSGQYNLTGDNNTALGYSAGPTTAGLTNTTTLGYQAQVSQSNSLVLGGTGANAVNVGIGTTAPAKRLQVVGSFNSTVAYGGFTTYNSPPSQGTTLLASLDATGGNGPQLRLTGAGPGFMDIGENSAGDFVVEGNDYPRLTVLNAGNVGIGTTAPTRSLQVVGTFNSTMAYGGFTTYNNFPGQGTALLASFDATGGNGSQVRFTGAGTSFMDIGENGTGDFVVEGNDYPRLTVLNTGNVGIGTTAPAYSLDVAGSINASGTVSANSVVLSSDRRFKQGIATLPHALADLCRLRGVSYTFRQADFPARQFPAGRQIGVIAQELEQVFPELVSTDAQGFKAVNYAQLTPVLIEALKELAARNAALETQLAAQQASTTSFEQRLRALEAVSASR